MNDQRLDEQIRHAIRSDADALPPIVRAKLEDAYGRLPDRFSHRRKRAPALWIGLIFAVLLTGTLVLGLVSPAMAQVLRQLPVIGAAFETAGDAGIQQVVKEGLATTVRQTVEDRGVSVTLDQAVFDGTRISVGLLHEPGISFHIDPSSTLSIDGQPLNASAGGVSKIRPDGMVATIFSFTPSDRLPEKFTLDFTITRLSMLKAGTPTNVDGNWRFSTPIVQLTHNVKNVKFDPPLVRQLDGIEVSVTEVNVTPLTTAVTYELIKPPRYDDHILNKNDIAKGEETIRNELVFQLWDSNGLQLEPLGASGSRDGYGPEQMVAIFAPASPGETQLTLKTFTGQTKMRSEGNGSFVGADSPKITYVPLSESLPYTVKQGEAGEIVFRSIVSEDAQTWIEYEVRGTEPYTQDGAWWIEDRAGERYNFDRYDQTRLREDAYVYRVRLPALPTGDDLRIAVVQIKPPEKLEPLDIRIPLQ